MVSPSFTLAPSVPLSAQVSHPLVHGEPLFSVGHWQTFATPELVTKSVLVTATRAPETLLTAPISQGYVTFDVHSTVATLAVGPLLSGQSVSLSSLASSPLLVPPFGPLTEGTPPRRHSS